MNGKPALTVTRNKYSGYDSTENHEYHECNAERAKDLINPDDVWDAIINIKDTFDDQLKGIEDALKGISTDADQAQIVSGTSMGPTIDETAEFIGGLGPQLYDGIDDIYTLAVEKYSEYQNYYNTVARGTVIGEGVSSPSETPIE